MADQQHGILEDIGAELGYTATCALVDWFGGQSLYIPTEPTPGHPIEAVIGDRAFARLVRFADDIFGQYDRVLCLPLDYQRELTRRDRMIGALLAMGKGTKDVARMAMLTERQVQNIRRRLEEEGLLPLILREAKPTDGVSEIRQSVRNSTPGTPCG